MKLIIPKYYELISFAKNFDVEVAFFGHILQLGSSLIVFDIFTVPQRCTIASISWDCEWEKFIDQDYFAKVLQQHKGQIMPFAFSVHKHPGDFGFSATDLSPNGICNRFHMDLPQVDLVLGKTLPVVDMHTKLLNVERINIEIASNMYLEIQPPFWTKGTFKLPEITLEPRIQLDKDHIQVLSLKETTIQGGLHGV